MAGPWEKYQQPAQQQTGPWARFADPNQAGIDEEAAANLRALGYEPQRPEVDPSDRSYTGQILPISYDAAGEASFDSNAGLLGALKAAVTAPGRALSGELQVTGPDGSVTPTAIGEALNFAGFASPMTPELRAGGYLIPGERGALARAKVEPPSEAVLKQAASDGYNDLRNLGVDYSTASVNQLSGEIQALLTQDGIIGTLAPKTYSILDQLSAAPAGSVASINGITAARKAFGNAARDFANPTEQLAAQRAIESLDGFLARSDPASVVSGPANQVAPLLRDANGNYAAYRRSKTLTDLADAAQLRANASNSGQNAGNTTRQRVASLLLNGDGKQVKGFSKQELGDLRAVNEGSAAANSTRYIGNLLGGGGGLGQLLTAAIGAAGGSAAGGGLGAAIGSVAPVAIGKGSKAVSNALTERALTEVASSLRQRSPVYEALLKDAPMVRSHPAKTDAILRLLLASESDKKGGGGW